MHNERKFSAYNQASRAVIAHELGLDVLGASINPYNDWVWIVSYGDECPVLHGDICLLDIAGIISETALFLIRERFGDHVEFMVGIPFTKKELENVYPWLLCYETKEMVGAIDSVTEDGYGGSTLIRVYEGMPLKIFLKNCFDYITSEEIWTKIWTVARALIDEGQLSGEKVVELIESAQSRDLQAFT
jgi:hypothetical protein